MAAKIASENEERKKKEEEMQNRLKEAQEVGKTHQIISVFFFNGLKVRVPPFPTLPLDLSG